MKTENCANCDVNCRWTNPGEHRNAGFIVWAGILIGLGAGLVADQLGAGFLIGLGLGLVGSELFSHFGRSLGNEFPQQKQINVTTTLIGAFLTYIGVSIIWAPVAIWPYAVAGFLVLIGVSFLIRGFIKRS